jgi:plasmid stabilization system protein ParE
MVANKKVVWQPLARGQLYEILEFYDNRNGSAAYSKKLLSKIEDRLSLIDDNFQLGEKVNEENVRRTCVEKFLIYYLIGPSSIDVLTVRDGRRKPKRFKLSEVIKTAKPLTTEQLEDFEIGRRQIAAGLTIPHEEVMKEFDALYPDDDE